MYNIHRSVEIMTGPKPACPYANALGVPGQGVHAAKFMGFAINDTLMTIAGSALIAYFFQLSFLITLLAVFVLGEVLHYVAGTQTAFLTWIGVRVNCS